MSNSELERAFLLFQQNRPAEARDILVRLLGEHPENPVVHALMSNVLDDLDEPKEAERHARMAIEVAPDFAEGHASLARVLMDDRKRTAEALVSIDTAIELEPEDPDYHGHCAVIQVQRKEWRQALDSANEGLALDPEHALSTNMRALAETRLGLREEAAATLDRQLARTPEDSMTHANSGWNSLHRGDGEAAEVHFREALALDPENEWARAGIREALQSRHWFYKPILAFFLWLEGLKQSKQFAVMFGGYMMYRVAWRYTDSDQRAVAVLAVAAVALYLVFVALTWFSRSISAALLSLHPMGALALNRPERWWARGISLAVLTSVLMLAGLQFLGWEPGVFGFHLLFVTAAVIRFPETSEGRPRLIYGSFLGVVVLVALAAVATGLGPLGRQAAHLQAVEELWEQAEAEGISRERSNRLAEKVRTDENVSMTEEELPAMAAMARVATLAEADERFLGRDEFAALEKRINVSSNLFLALAILAVWISQFVGAYADRQVRS